MQRTMYSVSDSVNSTGFSEDLNSGPNGANSGMADSCSEGRGGEGREGERGGEGGGEGRGGGESGWEGRGGEGRGGEGRGGEGRGGEGRGSVVLKSMFIGSNYGFYMKIKIVEPHQCNCRQLLFWTHSYWNLPDHRLHVMWNTATTGSLRKGKFTITTHWHRCPAWRRQERPSVQRLQEWPRQQLERSNKSYFLGLHNHTITGYTIAPSIVSPPKGGTRVPPPTHTTWFPLMWSLEYLICFDLMEKLYLPPPFFLYLGETQPIKSFILG